MDWGPGETRLVLRINFLMHFELMVLQRRAEVAETRNGNGRRDSFLKTGAGLEFRI